jgi:hypothetical protein
MEFVSSQSTQVHASLKVIATLTEISIQTILVKSATALVQHKIGHGLLTEASHVTTTKLVQSTILAIRSQDSVKVSTLIVLTLIHNVLSALAMAVVVSLIAPTMNHHVTTLILVQQVNFVQTASAEQVNLLIVVI